MKGGHSLFLCHNYAMLSLLKKVLGSGSSVHKQSAPPAQTPPSPDLSHLTNDELRILADVMRRQEQFEQHEQERVRRIKAEVEAVEQEVKSTQLERGANWKLANPRLCRICFKTRMVEGGDNSCSECGKRVCSRCGSYVPSRSDNGKNVPDAWLCRLCDLKREAACRTGIWYLGTRGQSSNDNRLTTSSAVEVLRHKLEICHPGLDSSSSVERGDSDMETAPSHHGSDSQLLNREAPRDFMSHNAFQTSGRRSSLPLRFSQVVQRRRSNDKLEDDEDDDMVDVLQERKISHQLRQQKRRRKRSIKNNEIKYDPGSQSNAPKDWHNKIGQTKLAAGNSRTLTANDSSFKVPDGAGDCSTRTSLRIGTRSLLDVNDGYLQHTSQTDKPVSDVISCQEPKPFTRKASVSTRRKIFHQSALSDLRKSDLAVTRNSFSDSDYPSSLGDIHSDHAPQGSGSRVKKRRAPNASQSSNDSRELSSSEWAVNSRDFEFHQHVSLGSSDVTIHMQLSHNDTVTHTTDSGLSHIPDPISHSQTVSTHTPVDKPMHTLVHTRKSDLSSLLQNELHYSSVKQSPTNAWHAPRHESAAPPGRPMHQGLKGDDHVSASTGNQTDRSLLCETEIAEYGNEVVRKILHKPTNAPPEAFGIRVTGGIKDTLYGLVALIKVVTPGSPAHLAGLQAGDEVVEWNGCRLAGLTFEQVLAVCHAPVSDTLLILTLPAQSRSSDRPALSHARQLSDPGRTSSCSSPTQTCGAGFLTPAPKRRILPRTPAEIGRISRHMCGEILLKLDFDLLSGNLLIILVMGRDLELKESWPDLETGHAASAQKQIVKCSLPADDLVLRNLPGVKSHSQAAGQVTILRTSSPREVSRADPGVGPNDTSSCLSLPSPFASVRLLPLRKLRASQKTTVCKYTNRPKWEETFIYDKVTITELTTSCLEVTVWSHEDKCDVFLGEVLLELSDWSHYAIGSWCPLNDHDENSPPLPTFRPPPIRNPSVTSSATSAFGDDAIARGSDASDISRHSQQPAASTTGLLPAGHPPGSARDFHVSHAQPDTFTTKLTKATKNMMRNKIASLTHSDRKDTGSDESSAGDVVQRRSISESQTHSQDERTASPGIQRRPSVMQNYCFETMDLLAPPRPLSRANSSSSFFYSDDSSDGDPYSPTTVTPDRPAPEGDDITSILGPGQVPPTPSNETLVCGDIKVGFTVTKGQLEVDVVCVRGLLHPPKTTPPDTYVKTYLMEGHKTVQKKKTQVIKACADPVFRRKIKYSACNVHGRHMRIVVWERPRNFERKQSLGETVIRLDALDLGTHTMTWYKLFPVNSTDLGSTDSLSQW